MYFRFYPGAADTLLRFAVIVAQHNGKWIFCKHRERDTYEFTADIVKRVNPSCLQQNWNSMRRPAY